jgi:HlyD family secretion protein
MDRLITKRKWTSKRIALWAGAGIVLLLIVWSIITRSQGTTLRVSADRLRIATATEGSFQEYVSVTGRVVPITTYYLAATEGGRVEEIYREVGSYVEPGDAILKLANTNLLLDIMYREAELFQQRNNLRNTKIAMEQNRLQTQRELLEINHQIVLGQRLLRTRTALARDSLVARRDFEDARDDLAYLLEKRKLFLAGQRQDSLYRNEQVKQLEESLDRIQTNLSIVRRNMDNMIVRAPIAGQLTALEAEIGQAKGRGERLGQIDVLDGFKLQLAVDEHYISRVDPEQLGDLRFGDQSYALVVDKVYPEVVRGRFTVDMRFADSTPEAIRRGQSFHVRLQLGECSPALLLANGGFYRKTGGRWAYVLDAAGKEARKREITLGRSNAKHFEVISGLVPGDRVITSTYEDFGDVDRLVFK